MIPFGIGFSELIVIMLVLLLVVGPDKLPDLARLFGKGLRTARKASDELRDALAIDELKREIYRPVDNWKTPLPQEKKEQISDAHGDEHDDGHDDHHEHEHDYDHDYDHDYHHDHAAHHDHGEQFDGRDAPPQSASFDDEDAAPLVQATSDPLLDGLVVTPQSSRPERTETQVNHSTSSSGGARVAPRSPEGESEDSGDA